MLKRRCCRVAILMISMFCMMLSSCGIPTIMVFDDNFSISTSVSGETYSFTISTSGISQSTFNDNSPGLLLLYTITNGNTSYDASTYAFNSTYASTTQGRPVSFSRTPKIATTMVGSEVEDTRHETGFYPLLPMGESSYQNISAPQYTESLNHIFDEGGQKITYNITLENNNENPNVKILNIGNDSSVGGSGKKYLRYNGDGFVSAETAKGENFVPPSPNDYEIVTTSVDFSTGTYINIYAAINCIGDFSNVYWTDLKRVAQIRID